MMTKKLLTNQQRKVLARFILRQANPHRSENPVAIFMAGLPGAGKTEQTKGLMHQMLERPLRIDMDEIAKLIEGYSPKKAHLFRRDATAVLEKLFDEAKKRNIWFVMDGTFSSKKAISNLERCYSDGYQIQLQYIHQTPGVAWGYTKARELVEKRAIEREGFINSYFGCRQNLETAINLDYVDVNVIKKDSDNKTIEIVNSVKNLDHVVGPALTREEIERDIMSSYDSSS